MLVYFTDNILHLWHVDLLSLSVTHLGVFMVCIELHFFTISIHFKVQTMLPNIPSASVVGVWQVTAGTYVAYVFMTNGQWSFHKIHS